jgi:hypothetical protein
MYKAMREVLAKPAAKADARETLLNWRSVAGRQPVADAESSSAQFATIHVLPQTRFGT